MKRMLAMVTVVAALAVTVRAEEAAPATPAAPPAAPKVKREAPPMQDLVLTGKVIQQEKITKNREGAEVKQIKIVLETADGMVGLPAAKKDGVDPAAFVDKQVTVTGKGFASEKNGKKFVALRVVEKIEPVQ